MTRRGTGEVEQQVRLQRGSREEEILGKQYWQTEGDKHATRKGNTETRTQRGHWEDTRGKGIKTWHKTQKHDTPTCLLHITAINFRARTSLSRAHFNSPTVPLNLTRPNPIYKKTQFNLLHTIFWIWVKLCSLMSIILTSPLIPRFHQIRAWPVFALSQLRQSSRAVRFQSSLCVTHRNKNNKRSS